MTSQIETSGEARRSTITAMETQSTFVMIKPDGVERRLVGEIIRRFEAKGLTIDDVRLVNVDEALAREHYAEHVEKPFFSELLTFITRSPVVAIRLSGVEAVSVARTMMGPTNPTTAAPGTIRGDFGLIITENLVHGSDSPESAERELGIWF